MEIISPYGKVSDTTFVPHKLFQKSEIESTILKITEGLDTNVRIHQQTKYDKSTRKGSTIRK